MTIQSTDIVLYESERMTDEASGGGRPTGKQVPDATLNALFQKTSRLDRTEGRINLTKVFCGVKTATSEAFQGSHFAIIKDAEDANVNVLCVAGTPTDVRSDARARIEAYLVPGVDARMFLLGDQYAGQRTILMFQETTAPLPELGSTLYIRQNNAAGSQVAEEYIKIASMDTNIQTFTYEKGGSFETLTRRVLTIKLSARLKNTLTGGTPYPTGTQVTGNTPAAKVYNTNVAAAAQFYGVSKLTHSAAAGSKEITVAEVTKPVVPSAYSENILTEVEALGELAQLAQAGSAQSTPLTFATVSGNQSRSYLPRVPARGMTLTIDSGVYKDDGTGALKFVSGTDNFSAITVSYETGQVDAWRKSGIYTSTATAAWIPAARLMGPAISQSIAVTQANRTFSWVFDCSGAIPELGTVTLWYRSMGKWQLIQDDGTGKLTGAGTGSVSLAGIVSATFSSLPDAETSIVLAWLPSGSLEHTALAGATLNVAKTQRLSIGSPIKPGSMTISWVSGGVAKSATDNGTGGMTGNVSSASVVYASGQVSFIPDGLPDGGYSIAYTRAPYGLGVVDLPSDSSAPATFDIERTLAPGTVRITYPVTRQSSTGPKTQTVTVTDNGAGKLFRDGQEVGVIDYAAGTGSFGWSKQYSYQITTWVPVSFGGIQSETETITANEAAAGAGTIQGLTSTDADGAERQLELPIADLQFSVGADLVAGSLLFTDNGVTYIDRAGVLWKSPASQTGAGERVGRVEYATGTVIVDNPKAMTGVVTIVAGVLLTSKPYITNVVWRTPGSPLKPANMFVTGTKADGTTITGSADASGGIAGAGVSGTVDITSGLCTATFSAPVAAASIKYSAVILTALPLDSDALGLDPVRLPPDGKVPIFSDGLGVIVGHTGTIDIATPTAGQVIDCGRDYIADFWITDAADKKLAVSQYTEDRDAGVVTMNAGLQLVDDTGAVLTPPLTLHHRIEHRSLLQDVQPNGTLTLAIPLAQDYPAGETYVSSYLRQGDRFASWDYMFTQQTWDNSNPNWTHVAVGPEILADYNEIDYPLQVTNLGAVDDEWLILFTSTTTFNIISRDRGLVSSGNITTDAAPVNPNTGTPYWTLRKQGWSSGWANGNVLRFTTKSVHGPIWLIRCVSIGVATHPDDKFLYAQYGDAA